MHRFTASAFLAIVNGKSNHESPTLRLLDALTSGIDWWDSTEGALSALLAIFDGL